MFLTGYPVEDLALRRSFVAASQHRLRELAAELDATGLGELPVVVGYLDRGRGGTADADPDRPLPQNRAGVLYGGEVVARYAKHHLPNYGVFDEFRIFAPGDTSPSCGSTGSTSPSRSARTSGRRAVRWPRAGAAGAELLLVINGSPYEREKDDTRLGSVPPAGGRGGLRAGLPEYRRRAGRTGLRRRLDRRRRAGEVLARGPQFREELLVVDLDLRCAR